MKNFKNVPQIAKERVARIFEKNRIPHCILITGGSEEQRLASAIYFAAALQCSEKNRPCDRCRACVKVKNGVHPDVSIIEAGGKSETVRLEDLKQIRENFYVLPNEGAARVYIIPDGGKIRTEGQNSLLKMTEEPPEFAFIILCAEVRSVLLPTVLSRAYEIALGAASAAAATARTQAKINDVCAEICASLAEKDAFRLITAMAPLEKDRNAVAACAQTLRLILRDALIGGETLSGMPEQARLLQKNTPPQVLIKMTEITEEIREAAGRNANVNLMLSLFSAKLFRAVSDR